MEWVNDYSGSNNDLQHSDEDALSLYNRLGSYGWVKKWEFRNYEAWEGDFKRLDLGGWEEYIIDQVDLSLFLGSVV